MGIKNFAVWVAKSYANDALFDKKSPLNRDNCLAGFHKLKDDMTTCGISCHTADIFLAKGVAPDIILFLDIPVKPINKLCKGILASSRKWVILQETEVIIPRNWDISLHGQFEKIFTWRDDMVDGKKYIKYNYTVELPAQIPDFSSKKSGFCVLIAGNHRSTHPLELYSRREEAVKWFEANHPGDFALYGRGWDKHVFTGPLPVKIFNRLPFLGKLFAPKFSSYKGTVKTKRNMLSMYRFVICYENVREMPGYITEKILDCFSAGCVPVYWGAPNISDHIPEDCFIDKRRFRKYEELYAFMKNMSGQEYERRLAAINIFLGGEKSACFKPAAFSETILNSAGLREEQ